MRLLLIGLVALLTLSSVFDWDPGPAPGLKLKNLILYALTLGLMLRASMDKRFRIELPGIQVAFALLITYAIVSYVAIVLVIDYPHYNVLGNALNLKGVVDQMLFFLVFFYGVRSEKDGMVILKCVLIAFALSHVMAVLDALAIVRFGDLEQREDGRVQGLVGESNQYGAFVAMSLPAIIAMAFTTSGIKRLLWLLASVVTAITLVMTVSRGAYVATFVAGACALVMFARYAPPGRLVMIALGGLVAVVVLGAVAAALGFGDLLYERLVNSVSGDMAATSSGRTDIWRNALETMFRHPLSLLTGFGWRAYWSMPFRFSPHNNYLNQWFNLGLIGLVCTVLLFVLPIRTARAAIARTAGPVRPVLMGYIVAALALAVATFFVELFVPWLYFWAYTGIAMRLAVETRHQATAPVQPLRATPGALRADPFGWSAPGGAGTRSGAIRN